MVKLLVKLRFVPWGKQALTDLQRARHINPAEKAKFEEVAYLLLYGELPNQEQLDNFISKINSLRNLPQELKDTLEKIPAATHPMDVLRTGCSMLGNLEPETSFDQQFDTAIRLFAALPSIIMLLVSFFPSRKANFNLCRQSLYRGTFSRNVTRGKPNQLASLKL